MAHQPVPYGTGERAQAVVADDQGRWRAVTGPAQLLGRLGEGAEQFLDGLAGERIVGAAGVLAEQNLPGGEDPPASPPCAGPAGSPSGPARRRVPDSRAVRRRGRPRRPGRPGSPHRRGRPGSPPCSPRRRPRSCAAAGSAPARAPPGRAGPGRRNATRRASRPRAPAPDVRPSCGPPTRAAVDPLPLPSCGADPLSVLLKPAAYGSARRLVGPAAGSRKRSFPGEPGQPPPQERKR